MGRAVFPDGLAGIIFDCDGVMIDSLEGNRQFYNLVLGKAGLGPITPEQEAFAFQATAEQALKSMLPEKWHGRLDELVREAVDYDRDVLPRIKLMPGFRAFIERAHEFGLRMAIDTNRTDFGIQRVLDFFSLPQYFGPVITSSNSEPKPSPQGALKICAAWQAMPAQALFVGDSPDDKAAAEGAGCVFAAFGPSGLSGDFKADSFSALGGELWPLLARQRAQQTERA